MMRMLQMFGSPIGMLLRSTGVSRVFRRACARVSALYRLVSRAVFRALVRAPFFAAAERLLSPLVRTALRAAAEREAAPRRLATRLACCDSAAREAELRVSRLSTCFTARETRGLRRVLRRP